jgi:3'-5' exoribonuclease
VADLRSFEPGRRVNEQLLVVEVDQRSYGEGRDCIILTFGNADGRIASAPFWSERRSAVAGLSRGDPVEVTGEIRMYRARRQLEVWSIRALPREQVEWARLLPSVGDVEPYWRHLDGWRGAIAAPRLRQVLAVFYEDPEFRARFTACPASIAGHHAQLGGLLRHTYEVALIARAIAEVSRADRDLVTAGALLHDIGKLESYTWRTGFAVTDAGSLLGHVVIALLKVARGAERVAGLTEREQLILQHLVASHHGRLELGAPVTPMTLEAEILHFADDASAKSASMADALADAENFVGDDLVSVRALWQLDRRRAYRGVSDWGTADTRK